MSNQIILFGATGFTGHLIAEALVRRNIRPILAGRSEDKLKSLATRLGDLEIRVADVTRPESVDALVSKGDILISTVGPFVQYGNAALQSCIKKGAHYLDSTGEPSFIREVFEHYDAPAREAGITLVTAFGYDYVPGNCVAAAALEQAGEAASRVDVGYYALGPFSASSMSQGTRASVMGATLDPGVFFAGGSKRVKLGVAKVRRFDVRGSRKPAAAVPGSEHLALPQSYAQLRDINTYLGWFGAVSYLMPLLVLMQTVLFKIPGYRALLATLSRRFGNSEGRGPDAKLRAKTGSYVVAQVYSDTGKQLSQSVLQGVNPYDFTAEILAWGAVQAQKQGFIANGALGPVSAFGLGSLVQGCHEAGLELTPALTPSRADAMHQ